MPWPHLPQFTIICSSSPMLMARFQQLLSLFRRILNALLLLLLLFGLLMLLFLFVLLVLLLSLFISLIFINFISIYSTANLGCKAISCVFSFELSVAGCSLLLCLQFKNTQLRTTIEMLVLKNIKSYTVQGILNGPATCKCNKRVYVVYLIVLKH